MKVGSIVECIANMNKYPLKGEVFPIKDGIYTIREIVNWPEGVGLRFEEIVNPKRRECNTHEVAFTKDKFRELLPTR